MQVDDTDPNVLTSSDKAFPVAFWMVTTAEASLLSRTYYIYCLAALPSKSDSSLRKDVQRTLLLTAEGGKTVTYGHLMKKFGLTRGRGSRGVVNVIGEIDDYEARRGGPGFGAIVVRKDTRFPGGGFFCYGSDLPPSLRRASGRGANPRLSKAEKEYVLNVQKAIWRHYRGK